MIEAEATYGPDRTMALSVTGHAGSGPKGHDLVCAAASMLLYSLQYDIMKEIARAQSGVEQHSIGDEDPAYIVIHPPDGRYEYCAGAFEMAVNGFRLLEHKYPEHVQLKCYFDGKK